jgi:hypothetical protein
MGFTGPDAIASKEASALLKRPRDHHQRAVARQIVQTVQTRIEPQVAAQFDRVNGHRRGLTRTPAVGWERIKTAPR